MDSTLDAIAVALAQGLVQVGGELIDTGEPEPALEPAADGLRKLVERGYHKAGENRALREAVRAALAQAGAPADDEDALARWLRGVGLDRLAAEGSDVLRRQFARVLLAFTGDPQAGPPQELAVALGWPRSHRAELSHLLAALRAQLDTLEVLGRCEVGVRWVGG